MTDIEQEARAEAAWAEHTIGFTWRDEEQRYGEHRMFLAGFESASAGASRPAMTDEGARGLPMTERDEYMPSLDKAREAWAKRNALYRASSGLVLANDAKYSAEDYAEFDRMIAAHDEAVRAEEREKAAQHVLEMARVIEQARAEEREKVAQIVERYWPKFTGVNLPNIIRAQGKEQ